MGERADLTRGILFPPGYEPTDSLIIPAPPFWTRALATAAMMQLAAALVCITLYVAGVAAPERAGPITALWIIGAGATGILDLGFSRATRRLRDG